MKRILYIIMCMAFAINVSAQPEGRRSFNSGWRFQLGDNPHAASPSFSDSKWRQLDLPHDWAIEGDFSQDNPSGTGGGALPGGIGWYRKTFTLDKDQSGKHIRIDFDGVYMNATVYINGHELGTRPYGYASFGWDVTKWLKGGKNVIAVRVDNAEQPNSRWYSGCGIYRNVWITAFNDTHVAYNGTFITADCGELDERGNMNQVKATLTIDATLQNDGKARKVLITHEFYDRKGHVTCATPKTLVELKAGETLTHHATLDAANPEYWSPESPKLYWLQTKLYDKATMKVIDRYETRIGLRKAEFTDKGFKLNGKPMQIQGVCNHHDLGCLGAALNKTALRRQLQLMKDMGINGIRCSHNPPAPELLDLCDEMGFIVMDEAFDMWRKKKTAHDYSRYFNEWHERDLTDLVVRDRNHPCVLMWSIGNEVLEQWTDAAADTLSLEQANLILNFGHSADQLAQDGEEMSVNSLLTKKLADMTRALDPTRPVTAGCNEPNPNNHLFKSGALDIIGFNYHNQNVPDVPKNFPGKPFIITESNSSLHTRGHYVMPSDNDVICPDRWDKPYHNPTFACSAYDNCHAPWGNNHEETLILMRKNPWISGQYIWTGQDYIGEPTPYGWPARSSYFGIVDLAGFPKDVYYLYQAELTDKEVLHLFPHWNWTEGQDVDLWAFYNHADSLELRVNGVSQGFSAKTDDRLHAAWRVKYQPGEVQVIAYRNGAPVRMQSVNTAGQPEQLRLTPDRTTIGGRELSFVTVEVVDKDGNLCPTADNLVNFGVSANLAIAGVDNGSPISLERFKDTKRKAFNGKCLVVLQPNAAGKAKPGVATLTATADGLAPAEVQITVK